MIQARNLHFSNSLSSPPASYPGFLGVLGGRKGREKDGEWWREGRRPETLRGRGCVCGLESQGRDDGCGRRAGECAALRNRESPGARAGGARSRRGGDAARGEREGKGAARARARARTRPPAGAPHSPSSALPRARASGCPRATARATPRVRRWTAERAGTEGGGGCCALAWLSVLVRAIWRSFPPHSVSRSSGWHCGVCTGRWQCAGWWFIKDWKNKGPDPLYRVLEPAGYFRPLKVRGCSTPIACLLSRAFFRNSCVSVINERINWEEAGFGDRTKLPPSLLSDREGSGVCNSTLPLGT